MEQISNLQRGEKNGGEIDVEKIEKEIRKRA